jgi:hypothetical protein
VVWSYPHLYVFNSFDTEAVGLFRGAPRWRSVLDAYAKSQCWRVLSFTVSFCSSFVNFFGSFFSSFLLLFSARYSVIYLVFQSLIDFGVRLFFIFWRYGHLLCFCPLTRVCSTLRPYSFPLFPVVILISVVLAIVYCFLLTDPFCRFNSHIRREVSPWSYCSEWCLACSIFLSLILRMFQPHGLVHADKFFLKCFLLHHLISFSSNFRFFSFNGILGFFFSIFALLLGHTVYLSFVWENIFCNLSH